MLAGNWKLAARWASPGFQKAERIITFLVTKQFWLESLLADTVTHARVMVPTPQGAFPLCSQRKKGLPSKPVPGHCCFHIYPGGTLCYLQGNVRHHIILWSCKYWLRLLLVVWWSVVWLFTHMLFFFFLFPWREVQSLERLSCYLMSYFSTSVIILDITFLLYLRSCFVSSHPQFWERGEVIHKKWK